MLRYLILLLMTGGVTPHKLKVADPFEKRSRMILADGNMMFHAANNRNISFRTSGNSSIFIGDVDIGNLPDIAMVTKLSKNVDAHTSLITNTVEVLKNFVARQVEDHKLLESQNKKITNMTADLLRIDTLTRQNTQINARQRRMIARILGIIRKFEEQGKKDACESHPCQYGGTCIRHWGEAYTCLCPDHRTGKQCEVDVDECEMYGGTSSGCQNNGTCINTDVGFQCDCLSGSFGPLCESKTNGCEDNPRICGEGRCTPDINRHSHFCNCNAGYEVIHESTSPTCVDINECVKKPCHPGVECTNLPGSFRCSGCPKGYEGNGQMCVDIDECALHNPCSKNPPVRCINTVGNYHCDGCPPGYKGDGHKCKRERACDSNPCHEMATCRENNGDMISMNSAGGYACFCPPGYIGDGIGMDGCEAGNGSACLNHNCLNEADCVPVTIDSFKCKCTSGYTGKRCETPSACLALPCKNNGRCISLPNRRYECECPHGYYGENCEIIEDGCGEHFRNGTGGVEYPRDFPHQDGRDQCDMIISPMNTEDQDALDLTFTKFEGMGMKEDGPTDCNKTEASIILYDGTTDRSPIIGTFCGDSSSNVKAPHLNSPFKFSSPRAMIRHKGKKGTFDVKWSLSKRTCYSHVTGSEGIIKFDEIETAEYTRCSWSISAPHATNYIEFQIPAIQMRTNTTSICMNNMLDIFSGNVDIPSARIYFQCQSTDTGMVVRTNAPAAVVAFTLSPLATPKLQEEFLIKWKAVESDTNCGGEFLWDGVTKFAGTIQTPNYPYHYPRQTRCIWGLGKEANLRNETSLMSIKLTISNFDIPDNSIQQHSNNNMLQFRDFSNLPPHYRRRFPFLMLCQNSYLTVTPSEDSMLARFCNHRKPAKEMYLPLTNILLTFQSSSEGMGKGFSIDYELVCGKKFTSAAGTIQSFNYPKAANGEYVCDYSIEAPSTHLVTITFKYLGLNAYSPNQCWTLRGDTTTKDYIEISGIAALNSTYAQRFHCSRYPLLPNNRLVTSGGHPINIRYSTSGHAGNTGFLIEYNSTDIGCGGNFNFQGTVTSPNFPEKYSPFMNCVYTISTVYGKRVRFNFETIDLESSNNPTAGCMHDRVEFYTSYDTLNHRPTGKKLGSFCGMTTPPPIISESSSMVMVFTTDRSVAGTGFKGAFQTIDGSMECDQTFTASSGTIFFNGTQSPNPDCDFHINVDHGQKIMLKINEMSLPCHKAALKIRNGIDLQSPGFALLGGDSDVCDLRPFGAELRSHSNRVFLQLKGLDMRTVSFNISYEQIGGGCGGLIEGFSGSIAAPQYPLKENRAMDCVWKVAVPPGNRISFMVSLLDDLSSSDDNQFCGLFANNVLNIYDSNTKSEGTLVKKFCTRLTGDPTVLSTDNNLVVEYKQGNTKPVFGFFSHFRTECNGIELTDFSGTIQSPGYPHNVGERRFCKWKIRTSRGSRITLYFHHFEMEKRMATYTPCDDNALTIRKDQIGDALVKNATGTTRTSSNVFCNANRPVQITSVDNEIELTFSSNKREKNHIWLSWTTEGCGGVILKEAVISANITDHILQLQDDGRIECGWSITAPPGKKIQANITNLLIYKQDCLEYGDEFNGLAFFDGSSNASSVPIKTHCAKIASENGYGTLTQESHGDEMYIQLVLTKRELPATLLTTFFSANITFVPITNDEISCGGIVDVTLGAPASFHSPKYPEAYDRGIYCEWYLKTATGYEIQLELKEYIVAMDHDQKRKPVYPIGANGNLCHSAQIQIAGGITIYAGNDSTKVDHSYRPPLAQICNSIEKPIKYDTMNSSAIVSFSGGNLLRDRMSGETDKDKRFGFKMTAIAVCGGVQIAGMEKQKLSLTSLPSGTNCTWIIKKPENADDGTKIYFTLEQAICGGLKNDRFDPMMTHSGWYKIMVDGEEKVSQQFTNYYDYRIAKEHKYLIYEAEDQIKIEITPGRLKEFFTATFSTVASTCGGELISRMGQVQAPAIDESFECIWTVGNVAGSNITLRISEFEIESDSYCSTSYLEIRENNSTGPLINRFCKQPESIISAEKLWIKLKYQKEEITISKDEQIDDGEEEEETRVAVRPKLNFFYTKVVGGLVRSRTIESPNFASINRLDMWKIVVPSDHHILIQVDVMELPEDTPIRFYESNSMPSLYPTGDPIKRLSGYTPQADFTLEYSSVDIFWRFSDYWPTAKWRIRWSPVMIRGNETEELDEGEKEMYSCGAHLMAGYDIQVLRYPESGWYESNEECHWTISRPRYTRLHYRIKELHMERQMEPVEQDDGSYEMEETSGDNENCEFDYISILHRGHGTDPIKRNEKESNPPGGSKYCHDKDHVGSNFTVQSPFISVYFKSDRSRGGRGFALEYWAECGNTHDVIKASSEAFSDLIMSPGYPVNYPNDQRCPFSISFQSRRRVQVELLDLDMEDSTDCTNDQLYISNYHPRIGRNNALVIFCGGLDKYNETSRKIIFPSGQLFINFTSNNAISGRGYKLRVSEVIEDCSNTIMTIDETTPTRVIQTPLWPKNTPRSTSCSWTLRAPATHKLSLTFDHDHFGLVNGRSMDDDMTQCSHSDDYVEVRDGSSFHSPLIGTYCGTNPPSTIVSSANYLHITLTTDTDGASRGFNATVSMASCGGTIVLREGQNTTLTSVNYPESYPSRENCTWTIRSPNTHFIEAQLNHFFVQSSLNCTQDSLTIRDGNETGEAMMDRWCGGKFSPRGTQMITNDRTLFRSSGGIMTVEFIANSDSQRGSRIYCMNKKCGFSMTLWPSKIACGGDVTDTSGVLTTPGFPGRLLSRISCTWSLNAGPGFRYALGLEFIDSDGYYLPKMPGWYSDQHCFGDIEVSQLTTKYHYSHYLMRQLFCDNNTKIITQTDVATIKYSDIRARNRLAMSSMENPGDKLYQPFRITYERVPQDFDDYGCQIQISDGDGVKNHTMRVAPPGEWQDKSIFDDTKRLFICHISIRRSRKRKGTTSLTIKDFQFESPFKTGICSPSTAFIDLTAAPTTEVGEEIIPFSDRVCNTTINAIPADKDHPTLKEWNKATLLPDIDLFIVSPRGRNGKYLEFTLDVEFDNCGGLITEKEGMQGSISSPGYGKRETYEPNRECEWVLRAPEDHFIKLTAIYIDVDHHSTCAKDLLHLLEGETSASVSRLCNKQGNKPLEDNSIVRDDNSTRMVFKSNSRVFTLRWKTDGVDERKGWQFDYEFMRNNETDCGYVTNSMNGVIRSPGSIDSDYSNNLLCLWDIQVPPGFHIRIHFNRMDIEKSENCKNDALLISEEHTGQGWAPNEFYYFIYDKKEMHSALCDISPPPDFTSESNRIMLNFTTNDKVVGRGFELSYEAVCGGVFSLSHGTLTSPHYPSYLPNKDMNCEYLIDPDIPEGHTLIVVVKINDIQLDENMVQYRRSPCASDYLQIFEAETKHDVYTYCAITHKGEEKELSFSVKGPIGIRLQANKTFGLTDKKLVRGFKLTWALNRCGGETSLVDAATTGLTTSFYSPGFPLDYHDSLDCTWIFKTTPDRVFSYKFAKLDIENEDNCDLDRVEVHNGNVTTDTSLVGKYCGHVVPKIRVNVNNNMMIVRLVTDHSQSHSGFLMEITATLGPDGGCGGNLEATGDWKTFSSPIGNITTGYYPTDLRCGWNIKGTSNSILELKIIRLKTEKPTQHSLSPGKSCIDFLAVYDGHKTYSPLIESDICEHKGITLPKTIHTAHSIAHVYFESDHSIEAEGFTIEYRSVAATCGGSLLASREKKEVEYFVTRSPTEGQTFERCRWVILSHEQAPIWMRITKLNFPMTKCDEDYAEIRDVGMVKECDHPGCALRAEQRNVRRECGVKHNGIAPFVSNTLVVQLSTSLEIMPDSGYSLKFEYYTLDVCNRTVDGRYVPSSRVTSPHFPRPYDNNHTCETTIQVGDKQRILLVFRVFEMEHPIENYHGQSEHDGCILDYLEIGDPARTKEDAFKICGQYIPHPILSHGNVLDLFLKSDDSVVGDGYDISYYAMDAMDDNTFIFASNHEQYGAMQQPGYPAYNSSTSYKWIIAPPAGHPCKLSIEELDINVRKNPEEECGTEEKLSIIISNSELGSAESNIDSCNLSEEDKLPISVDFQGEIVVTFISDAKKENDGRGFRATWKCENYEDKSV